MPSRRLPCSQMTRTTSCGRRWHTAASAASASAAVRAVYPSSRRIPAISSRMSSSSSTMSSSGAISDPFFIPLIQLQVVAYGFLIQRKHQAHFRARLVVLAVGERNFSAVLLDDLAHDGEAEARAFRARGHIGFGQRVAFGL